MLIGLYILVDDEFGRPLYADPDPRELESDLWEHVCELALEAVEGDRQPAGVEALGEVLIGWKTHSRFGLSFVVLVDRGVNLSSIERYLQDLSTRYFDEVDNARSPERDGVADVVVDVIPAWEDEED